MRELLLRALYKARMELRRLSLRSSYWGERGNEWKVLRRIYGGCLCVSGVQQQRWRHFWRSHFLGSKRTIMRPSPQPESAPSRMLPRRRQQLQCTPQAAFLLFPRFPRPLHFPVPRPRARQVLMKTDPGGLCPASNSRLVTATSTSAPAPALATSTITAPMAVSPTTLPATSD